MFKVSRLCIPIGSECNFRCRYCFRDQNHPKIPSDMTDVMKAYLRQVSPAWCRAVVLSGGEPLLHWDTVKKIRELVNPSINVCILSNGSLLTSDKVNYINSHYMEYYLSHDGVKTQELRGVDVLENPDILECVKRIRLLTIAPVITNKNPDVMEVYHYIARKLRRDNFYYLHGTVMDNGHCQDLIDGFDYDIYGQSYREFVRKYYKTTRTRFLIGNKRSHCSFEVNLHGVVTNKITGQRYGTVLDSYADCELVMRKLCRNNYCSDTKCPLQGSCSYYEEYANEHNCRCSMIRSGYL